MVSHGVASERLSAERDGCACLSNAGTRNPLQTLVDLCDLCLPENKEIFRLDRLISSARSAGVEATRDTADDGALNHVEQRDSADQHDNEDKKQSANIIIKNTRRRASAPRNAKKKALLHLSLDPTSRRAGPPDIKESASKTAINRMPVTPSTPNTMTTRSSKMKTRSGCPLSPLDSIASPFPATQALVSKNEREDDEGMY